MPSQNLEHFLLAPASSSSAGSIQHLDMRCKPVQGSIQYMLHHDPRTLADETQVIYSRSITHDPCVTPEFPMRMWPGRYTPHITLPLRDLRDEDALFAGPNACL